MNEQRYSCTAAAKCGSCTFLHVPYKEQLTQKQKTVEKLLGRYGKVQPVIGMEDPRYYRNKVHHAFSYSRKTGPIHGSYQEDSHKVVMVKDCLLEDQISQKIIDTVCSLLPSFKITVYNEDTGFGLLRHILVRRGFTTGEIMVVLVAASPVFPSKNNFVKALRKIHPEITSVVLNINSKRTSMVLGERNITLYGPGFITDILCRKRFRISPSSFYQVNPVQTEKLYTEAIRMAGLTRTDTVLDAYCGIGTIGMAASGYCKEVCGVELNPEAVRDARTNAKVNGVRNIRFIAGDAGEFMERQAAEGTRSDVVFMDPPRAGSDERFLRSLMRMGPDRVVYISCNPETLARDLRILTKGKYTVQKIQPVDMFPFCDHIECVSLLQRISWRL